MSFDMTLPEPSQRQRDDDEEEATANFHKRRWKVLKKSVGMSLVKGVKWVTNDEKGARATSHQMKTAVQQKQHQSRVMGVIKTTKTAEEANAAAAAAVDKQRLLKVKRRRKLATSDNGVSVAPPKISQQRKLMSGMMSGMGNGVGGGMNAFPGGGFGGGGMMSGIGRVRGGFGGGMNAFSMNMVGGWSMSRRGGSIFRMSMGGNLERTGTRMGGYLGNTGMANGRYFGRTGMDMGMHEYFGNTVMGMGGYHGKTGMGGYLMGTRSMMMNNYWRYECCLFTFILLLVSPFVSYRRYNVCQIVILVLGTAWSDGVSKAP
jgi:hypothetical protein